MSGVRAPSAGDGGRRRALALQRPQSGGRVTTSWGFLKVSSNRKQVTAGQPPERSVKERWWVQLEWAARAVRAFGAACLPPALRDPN